MTAAVRDLACRKCNAPASTCSEAACPCCGYCLHYRAWGGDWSMFGGALLRARTAARLALPGVLLVPGLAACGGVTAVVACSAPEQGGAQPRSAGDASPPPAPASSGAQYWGPRVEAFRKEMRRKAGFDTFIHRREPGAEAPSAEELAERSASTLAADWSPEQDAEARWNRTLGQVRIPISADRRRSLHPTTRRGKPFPHLRTACVVWHHC